MLAAPLIDDVGGALATNMITGFALELSLKLFYMTFNEEAPPATHNLNDLWHGLPEDWRAEISREYAGDARSKAEIVLIALQRAPSAPSPPAAHDAPKLGSADGFFKTMSEAFTYARYFYEKVEVGEWAHIVSAPNHFLAMIDVLASFYEHRLTEAAKLKT
jgi:hypothetical protein